MRRRPTLADMNVRRSVFEDYERNVDERELERHDREQEEREPADDREQRDA